jgi:hypothetical protein
MMVKGSAIEILTFHDLLPAPETAYKEDLSVICIFCRPTPPYGWTALR